MIFNKAKTKKVSACRRNRPRHLCCADTSTGSERPATFFHNRVEKPSKDRGQRTRKLQLSDVDW